MAQSVNNDKDTVTTLQQIPFEESIWVELIAEVMADHAAEVEDGRVSLKDVYLRERPAIIQRLMTRYKFYYKFWRRIVSDPTHQRIKETLSYVNTAGLEDDIISDHIRRALFAGRTHSVP